MRNPGLKYGMWGAISVVLYFLMFYFVKKELFLNPGVQWGSMLIYIACMYKAAEEDMQLKGISRDFRLLSRPPFIAFLVINLAYWLYYYGLHLADPSMLTLQTDMQLEMLHQTIADGVGDPEHANKIREQINYLENEGMSMTLGPVLMRMTMGAIGGFALSAILVFVIKRKLGGVQ